MDKLAKAGVIAIIALLLTASIGLYVSWLQMQNEERCKESCPLNETINQLNQTATTTVNATANATSTATKNTTIVIATPTPTPKKTLIFITMPNCPYCEQMKPVVASISAKGYTVQEISTDSNPAATLQYAVRGTPTLIVQQDGKEVQRFVGVVSEETLINALS